MATRNTGEAGKCSVAVSQEVRAVAWWCAQGLCLLEATSTPIRREVTIPLRAASGSQTPLQCLGHSPNPFRQDTTWGVSCGKRKLGLKSNGLIHERKKGKIRPVVLSDSPRARRLIVLLGCQVLRGALRMDCSTFWGFSLLWFLLMDSVFQDDGGLKTRHLTNDNMSDLLRESLCLLLSRPPLLANYITWLEVGFRESILPLPNR